jgi:anti-sigma B factor antagonist
MSLKITLKEINDVVIISLIGTLDTNTSPEAEVEINKSLDNGSVKMAIDLENTRYVSSAGLRIFLATAKKMMAKSGKVILCHPNDIVKDILHVSGFNTIIVVKATVKEALNNF